MKSNYLLLVEDNPDDEHLTLRALSSHGLLNEVTVARDGAEALATLTPERLAETGPPVVILLDLKLPKVSGLEVLKHIRTHEETRLLPVVVLTSSTEDRDIIESYRLGANSFVSKPVNFDEFSSAVRQLGLYWMLLNQHPVRS